MCTIRGDGKKEEREREGGRRRKSDEPITLVTNDCTIVRDVDTIGDVAAYVLWMRDRDGVQFTTPSQGIKSRQRGKVYYPPPLPRVRFLLLVLFIARG